MTAGVKLRALGAASIIALAGCGGSESSDAGDTVTAFAADWKSGDYAGACERMDPDRYISLADDAARIGHATVGVNDCEKALEVLASEGAAEVGEIQDVDQGKDAARVETPEGTWMLRESDGDWLITEIPLSG